VSPHVKKRYGDPDPTITHQTFRMSWITIMDDKADKHVGLMSSHEEDDLDRNVTDVHDCSYEELMEALTFARRHIRRHETVAEELRVIPFLISTIH
jgi:hypothetical protein